MNNIKWVNGEESIVDLNRCKRNDCKGCEREHNASCGELIDETAKLNSANSTATA